MGGGGSKFNKRRCACVRAYVRACVCVCVCVWGGGGGSEHLGVRNLCWVKFSRGKNFAIQQGKRKYIFRISYFRKINKRGVFECVEYVCMCVCVYVHVCAMCMYIQPY